MDSINLNKIKPIVFEEQINKKEIKEQSQLKKGWERLKNNKLAVFGIVIILLFSLLAIFVPVFSPYSFDQQNMALRNQGPSFQHWFGTDSFGRDLFTRVWFGARISLFIAVAAATIDLIIGAIWGGLSGYHGGKIDEGMMRVVDILNGLPYLLIVVILMVVMGKGIFTIIIAMSITGWTGMARVVRGEVLRLKEREFILASKTMGAGSSYILFRHLIPNSLGPIIVTLTLTIPSAIFTEAFLSFLGLGVKLPMASWGVMIKEGLESFHYYPAQLFFPALFISLTMLAFNVLGDGLRDALDPRIGNK